MSEQPAERRQPESMAVQLTRMEGVINLMAYKLDEVVTVTKDHGVRLGVAEVEIQRLKDELKADAEQREAVIAALRENEDSKQERSRARWTPWERVIAAGVALIALGSLVTNLLIR